MQLAKFPFRFFVRFLWAWLQVFWHYFPIILLQNGVSILDHTLTQRGDCLGRHSQLLS